MYLLGTDPSANRRQGIGLLEDTGRFQEVSGLDGVIDSRIGDALEEIPKLEGEFDFIFIDAWKPDYLRYFELLRDRIAPGGAITAHNVVSQEEGMRDFITAIETDPEFETTIQRTSTEGISVSIKRR